MPRWPSRGSAIALGALLLGAGSCRGVLAPPREPVIRTGRPAVDTTRRDTVVGDTAFPMMPAPARVGSPGPAVRIALATAAADVRLSASEAWLFEERDGSPLASAGPGERWRITRTGTRLRAERDGGSWGISAAGPIVIRTRATGGTVRLGTRRYRGELVVDVARGALVVVNRLPMEEYLRGVVPLEIGERTPAERAAVEAQAIAARTYAYSRMRSREARYDMLATVDDQVYGGADAERPVADAAVLATSGLVLRYAGRLASAPYHSTCGGSTAEPNEVWSAEAGAPYLQRVSDRIPGTDRHYCDPSPRFTWVREMSGDAVASSIDRYLRSRGGAAATARVGNVYALRIAGRTPSGRVAALVVDTDAGERRLERNAIRYALRGGGAGGTGSELLNSTYFSVDAAEGGRGGLARVVLRGGGYGHGVGMCQWGAIGRARAGQDARTILRTYYPGTSVGSVE